MHSRFRTGVTSGIEKGWRGFVWLLKILIPISFMTVLLDYSGILHRMDFLLKPVMGLLHLPSIAALPIIVGMLTGVYGAIASMVMLPLSVDQMTLVAVFVLISHNLIQEGAIQGNSGVGAVKATVFRLSASVITVLVVGLFLEASPVVVAGGGANAAPAGSFGMVMASWLQETLWLSVKIFCIIMGLMLFLELMRSYQLIQYAVNALTPLLKLMGLDRKVGLLWLTAAAFGLSYGGAVIMEEARQGNLSSEDLEKLHLSIGINHSMIEDPALFLPLGLSAFWLWVPRLIMAVICVHLMGLCQRIKSAHRYTESPGA